MTIVEALVAHHDVLRRLYAQAETNPEVFEDFIRHLVIHHTMEEKYFYDLLGSFAEAEHDSLEAVNEHHIIELIIKDAQGFPRDHQNFPIKIEGLGEYTSHHLDEEEADIFPMAQKLFAAEELEKLGALFEKAKQELLGVSIPELPKVLADKFNIKATKTGAKTESAKPAGQSVDSAAYGLGIGALRQ
ncbi:MAG: hemerythrin domain-containing protein [Desulfofustis sp. PB-SRB1]|mgnify:CR=1 FL=1|jgi:hemerythrin superfamily protein|nr:hemerythrin domain-containing protein [Desulfofustis sp. PB-SRB1]MBM1001195.1 hemerythrin domain-containing protein [Desulfofustis sp. PB-SRB1]HBH28694.1 hemerythrin domain-containing protein [Desulfofustis sp.]HBH30804.1 hemerythrin domain-containing protein [Desulfofustis sp.]